MPSLVQGLQALWERYGQTLLVRWDGMRDQRLRDQAAALEATSKVQRDVLEGEQRLAERTAKDKDRFSSDWWKRGAPVVLLALALSACSMIARPPLPVRGVKPTLERPAFESLTEAQRAWLQQLVEAQEANCTRLDVIGGASPSGAADGCAVR